MSKQPRYVSMVLMSTAPAWLALSHEERDAFNDQVVNPIIGRYANQVSVRMLDAEAFTGRCTDVALFETDDLQAYYFLMEELRDTPLFSKPYFEVNDIIVTMEGGFRQFEEYQRARDD